MEVKRRERAGELARGSGPGARRPRADALGPRKDVIIRMPEEEATNLKVVAALERMMRIGDRDVCDRPIDNRGIPKCSAIPP